ncbi:MAG: AraC family transcriptional regulator [Cyanobacteria bacterium P01_H01_bin.105]
MAARVVINDRDQWLLPGSPDDARLFHSDSSDQILLYPSNVGQGYRQYIRLRDDLTLAIVDYVLARDLIVDTVHKDLSVKFDFPIPTKDAITHRSYFGSLGGFRALGAPAVRMRVFEIEVIFKGTAAALTYNQACVERSSIHIQQIFEETVQSVWRSQGGRLGLTTAEIMRRLAEYAGRGAFATHPEIIFEQAVSDSLYAAGGDLNYANRPVTTPAMVAILKEILSCPYQGRTRRHYLERQAMSLVTLRLQAMGPPKLPPAELDCIYHAASILRREFANPPTVEQLARQVKTNRLKLNQGFHEVYGTTPFQYLRNCRILQARRLLITSNLSIDGVAAAVGYSSRSHFTKAFRKLQGLNPKVFQMQVWPYAS